MAKTFLITLRNPLYQLEAWELHVFWLNDLLNPSTGKTFTTKQKKMLQQPNSVHNLLLRMKVETLCTTDDPIDSLADHKKAAQSGLTVQVLPTWRPDKAMNAENPILYADYINKLAEVAELDIKTAADLIQALQKRHNYFHQVGCRISDHGIEEFYASDYSDSEIEAIFKKVMSGTTLQKDELFNEIISFSKCKNGLRFGWAQPSLWVLRNKNRACCEVRTRHFDSIGISPICPQYREVFDRLVLKISWPKQYYNINPADNEVIATMLGNFNEGPTAGKKQFGSGWWFLDQKQGMIEQMNSLSALGLISKFVGMLTDSRSFLSFPRHEYFRRIMCNLFGEDMENGELPNDFDLVGSIVQDISYNNAKNYFKF